MNIESIELICEKLGTTIDKLLPSVISYGIHAASVWSAIGFLSVIVGICFTFMAHQISHSGKYNYTDDRPVVFVIIGISMIIIGGVALGFNLWQLHMWHITPELTAYKEIAGWFKG